MPLFSEDDTVMIFRIDDNKITRYGYAKHDEENDMIVIDWHLQTYDFLQS